MLREHPQVFARCSSEFPFYPGAYQIVKYIQEGRFGRIIEVESGLWHSSDLDPNKPINWKRILQFNGEYGCLGDLGMHPLHIPLRFGWLPAKVRGLLSKIVTERPDGKGGMTPCETWDNAILACEVRTAEQHFPMLISTKRIAPGEGNTWFLKVHGTEFSYCSDTVFHWRMARDGHKVLFIPSIHVVHTMRDRLGGFLRHVLEHRRAFASVAASEKTFSMRKRFAAAMGTVFLPFLLVPVIAWRVVRAEHLLRHFLPALPIVLLGLLARAWGEFLGFATPKGLTN